MPYFDSQKILLASGDKLFCSVLLYREPMRLIPYVRLCMKIDEMTVFERNCTGQQKLLSIKAPKYKLTRPGSILVCCSAGLLSDQSNTLTQG